jgi:glucan phosphoethanolaminetransferase (alkaline phosphatase superfamily)
MFLYPTAFSDDPQSHGMLLIVVVDLLLLILTLFLLMMIMMFLLFVVIVIIIIIIVITTTTTTTTTTTNTEALQPLIEPWPLLRFLILYRVSRTPLVRNEPIARLLHTERATRIWNPCLKWD